MSSSDEELLEALRHALEPGELVPSEKELSRLHQVLGEDGRVAATSAIRHRNRQTSRRRMVIAAAGAVLAALGAFAGGVAVDTLPGPLRTAAFDLDLPVSSPALVATRGAEGALRVALSAHDRTAVLTDAAVLRQHLAELDATDRKQAEPEAEDLLTAAAGFLATNGAPGENTSPQPPSTVPPETTTTSEPAEQVGPTTTSQPESSSESGPSSGSSDTAPPAGGSTEPADAGGDRTTSSG